MTSRALVLLLCVAICATTLGCTAGHRPAPDVIQAGQLDIKLPTGWTLTAHGAVRPSQPTATPSAAAASAPDGTSTNATIPLAKTDPTTAFFQATGEFSACLRQAGVKFIGVHDAKNPSSPANDPNYIKSLSTCAASSHILQALKDFQASQADLTPAQIQQQNQAFLKWRQCMIGRGWVIPEPQPDSQGKLFTIGGQGGLQLTPPPGQDIVSSPDIRGCAGTVQSPSPSASGA